MGQGLSFLEIKEIKETSMLISKVYNIFSAILNNIDISRDYMQPSKSHEIRTLAIKLIK